VLYLFFDAAAHALLWVLTRVFRVSDGTARALLGLDLERTTEEGESAGSDSRNGFAGVPNRLTPV
jgi:cobalt-zinc-cadmium resistance protein CzcA